MPVNKNLERLMSETMNAASAGDLSAQWRYAFLLMDACNSYEQYKEGLLSLVTAATRGHVLAQIDLAYIEFYGKGCEKNLEGALALCENALTTIEKKKLCSHRDKEGFDDPSNWLIAQQRAIRLRDTILEQEFLPKQVSDAQSALFQSLENHDWSHLENMLDENVILSLWLKPPCVGKTDVLNWFEERMTNRDYEVSFVPTERHGMVVEVYFPNDKRNIVRSLFLVRTNKGGKIDRIAHRAYNGDFGFSVGREPFSWGEIEPCLNDLEVGYKPYSPLIKGRMFCMYCGKLSHELRWIRFHSKPTIHDRFTYGGTMSVCTDCRQQVEFCFRYCKI